MSFRSFLLKGFSDESSKSEYTMNNYVETAPEFGNVAILAAISRTPHGGNVR